MRITSIELTGTTLRGQRTPRAAARISRKPGEPTLCVEIWTPEAERTHTVDVHCDEDIRSMADCLQATLDGCRGTNFDRYEYFTLLRQVAI